MDPNSKHLEKMQASMLWMKKGTLWKSRYSSTFTLYILSLKHLFHINDFNHLYSEILHVTTLKKINVIHSQKYTESYQNIPPPSLFALHIDMLITTSSLFWEITIIK